jgi:spermidine/putrescine transport system ATP-binding protein
VDTLSGGEAQRIALARALVNRPSVLLLDEPLSALDLQIRRQLQVELKEIHRELGRTFVYVTHDQEEAMSMSDRIVVMNEGEIIQIGSPIDVYRKPASLFTASFVGSSNLWPGEIVEAGADGVTIDVGGRRLPARPAPGIRPGDRAWILIRPESIVLSPRPQGGDESPTAVHARVVDVRFVGSIVHYRVTFGDRIITASRPPDDARLFSEGEDVVAKWQGSDALILKE